MADLDLDQFDAAGFENDADVLAGEPIQFGAERAAGADGAGRGDRRWWRCFAIRLRTAVTAGECRVIRGAARL